MYRYIYLNYNNATSIIGIDRVKMRRDINSRRFIRVIRIPFRVKIPISNLYGQL